MKSHVHEILKCVRAPFGRHITLSHSLFPLFSRFCHERWGHRTHDDSVTETTEPMGSFVPTVKRRPRNSGHLKITSTSRGVRPFTHKGEEIVELLEEFKKHWNVIWPWHFALLPTHLLSSKSPDPKIPNSTEWTRPSSRIWILDRHGDFNDLSDKDKCIHGGDWRLESGERCQKTQNSDRPLLLQSSHMLHVGTTQREVHGNSFNSLLRFTLYTRGKPFANT
ncbi:hypothetical protein H6P81_008244 [Aristolochia fimbriata]|uniref:Uncharacterized protein n=1 Tax=Aristolochia fimbriata TaxID=158543 RepID=A0AAV7F2H2_ARIFI|nr:hypothetical protein H6P81_008244 [Aristolochia fimbriata]